MVKGQTNNFVLKNRLQRTLRRNMTDAEQALWKRLCGCQVEGRKFRRQHPFGDFILDFVCLEAMLVVEVDGGQHNGSAQDLARDRVLESAGFRVMRFWNNQVLSEVESVVETIWRALETHPHPNPPLEGEGAKLLPLQGEGGDGGGWDVSPPLRDNPSADGERANGEGVRRPHPFPLAGARG